LSKIKHYDTIITQSDHSFKKYQNKVKDFIPTGSEKLWVSSVNYIQLEKGFVYLSLTMDAFSRNAECRPIMHWALRPTLEAQETALKMAFVNL